MDETDDPAGPESGRRGGPNSSAGQAFRVLRLVSQAQEPLGVAEIGRRLDMPTTTVHRILGLLEQSRYLGRLETAPRYEPGPMPQTLARALFRRFALRDAALPVLKLIARETGETVTLSVRLGWLQVRVAVVYGAKDLYSPGQLGLVQRLHDEIAGRSILAFLSSTERAGYRAFVGASAPECLPGLDALDALLPAIRRQALAADAPARAGERSPLALPLRRADDDPVGAILVHGPVAAMRQGVVLRPSWAAHADRLEHELRTRPELSAHPYGHVAPDTIAATMLLSGATDHGSDRASMPASRR